MTPQELIEFEEEIATAFNTGQIKAPVHLYYGNEEQMLDIFKEVNTEDWVLCSWRSHYQCLLKGVPRDRLKAEILAGRSISLCFPEHRIFSSAIVGGVLPIAVGIGLGIKRRGGTEKVHCFLGEMTSETGIAHSSIKYCELHDLPVRFIIEDNAKSVCTETRETWNTSQLTYENHPSKKVVSYTYQSKYPHAGAGVRVQF